MNCITCGFPRGEHHYNGACYGICADFTEAEAMTSTQYRTALEALGLTQDSAAHFLDVSLRTSHGYANGSPIPEGYAKLLRLMIRLKLKPEDVR